jgi:hypothetical protein
MWQLRFDDSLLPKLRGFVGKRVSIWGEQLKTTEPMYGGIWFCNEIKGLN